MIRIAAVGDLHYGEGSQGILRPGLEHLPDRADLLLLAGDLTRWGKPEEVQVLADELRGVPIPMIAVLGNHDYHCGHEVEVRHVLEGAGVRVLEGEGTTVEIDGVRVGIAGTKGFGGGFRGAHGSDFGEPEMKAFVGHTKMLSDHLAQAVDNAGADLVVHGHAHHGSEKGRTPAGIPVRNVAQPLIRHAYNIYTLDGHREVLAAAARGIS